MEGLRQLERRYPVDPAAFAWAYLGMGKKDETLACLDRAYARHSNIMDTLKVEPGGTRCGATQDFRAWSSALDWRSSLQAVAPTARLRYPLIAFKPSGTSGSERSRTPVA